MMQNESPPCPSCGLKIADFKESSKQWHCVCGTRWSGPKTESVENLRETVARLEADVKGIQETQTNLLLRIANENSAKLNLLMRRLDVLENRVEVVDRKILEG